MQDLSAADSLSLGDSFYVDRQYDDAINAYAAALLIPDTKNDAVLRFRSLSHRSAAFFQLERYTEALEDARQALEILSSTNGSPANDDSKNDNHHTGLRTGEGEICHQRVGMAALKLKDYETAKVALEQASQLAVLNHRSDQKLLPYIRECEAALKKAQAKSEPTPAKIAVSASESTTKTASMISATSTAGAKKTPTMPKYQYYQSDKFMTISILEPNVQREDLVLTLEAKHITVQLRKDGVDLTVMCSPLYSEINVDLSKVVIKAEKALIKLKKTEAYEWQELFGKPALGEVSIKRAIPSPPTTTAATSVPSEAAAASAAAKARPYASHKDWDAIERDAIAEEKNEKPEGDAAMNKLFQQIYASSSEETKRAMVKSYQTSGGTVLSTNWDEVKTKDYEEERTAPKGMEWKNWEGKKLPTKDDD